MIGDRLRLAFQWALPQHALSRAAGWAARARFPKVLVRGAAAIFARAYGVDWQEAEVPPGGFGTFGDFFTRRLVDGARPIEPDPEVLVSPVDGRVQAAGTIRQGALFQAKGQSYLLGGLLGSEEEARTLEGGGFATFYLSPRDYHRIHAPCDLCVRAMSYLPGALYSVSPATVRAREQLFARNERVAVFLDGPAGPFVMVMVGAMIVGSIEVCWEGIVAPPQGRRRGARHWDYAKGQRPALAKGAELGRFHMGSTVIVLVPPATGRLDGLGPEESVRLGRPIGRLA